MLKTKTYGFASIIVLALVIVTGATLYFLRSNVVGIPLTKTPLSNGNSFPEPGNPVSVKDGEFVKINEKGKSSLLKLYACARSEEEVMKLGLSLDLSEYIPNVPEVLETVEIEDYPEYYHVKYENGNTTTYNILRCEFYESTGVRVNTNSAPLGVFKGATTQENLNHLVEFLFAAKILSQQSCGMNCASEETLGVFEDNENEITRIDKYVLSVSNDVPPFQSSTLFVEQKFSLNKKTGVFTEYYSKKE